MPNNSRQVEEALKAKAEANFKAREEGKIDAPKAVTEYRAAEEATRSLTRKLREERLARAKG